MLLLRVRVARIHLPPNSSMRTWLRTMVWDNTFVERMQVGSHYFGKIPFRIEQGIWVLAGFSLINICFGIMILRAPVWARWCGTIGFGIGFLVGCGSLLAHPTLLRALITIVDVILFIYFAWFFPRHLVLEELVSNEVPIIDRIIENA